MKKSNLKVLFYTNTLRAFRSNLIGYLYEICQVYPVILLSEELDPKTEKIIKDKSLFPKLEKIIPIGQYDREKNIWKKHSALCHLAESIIKIHKPDVVIAIGSFFFESYLRRFAKKEGAVTISGIGPLLFKNIKDFIAFRMLLSTHLSTPAFLPFQVRMLFIKLKKHLGQFFYYWILPLLARQKPFIGEPSSILWWDYSRSKGADYYFVFTKRDYDFLIQQGMSVNKLRILAHPLSGKSREFFKEIYLKKDFKKNSDRRILTIMWPLLLIGFRHDNYSVISEKETKEHRIKIIRIISKILKEWKIFIKPHPMIKDIPGQFEEIVQTFEPISNLIKVVDPAESAEEYIEISDAIMGFPPACMTLFTASLQTPEKPILSLNLKQELLGDFYNDSDIIEYIDTEEKFIDILEKIRDNKYYKNSKIEAEKYDFSNIVELLEYLLSKKN